MKSDILLVMCPAFDPATPPVGLAYISSYIRQKGFSTAIMDMNIDLYHKADQEHKELWKYEYSDHWLNEDTLADILKYFQGEIDHYIEAIASSDSNIIGFSVNLSNFKFSAYIAQRVKERDNKKIIVFGGPQCFAVSDERDMPLYFYINHKPRIAADVVDVFVVGEGEETIVELISKITRKHDFKDTPGTIVYDSGTFTRCAPRIPIAQLDLIDYPQFKGFNLKDYTVEDIPILMSRGCVNRCAFCNNPYLSHKYRCRSADKVFDEIHYHYTHHNATHFAFCDLLINGNLQQLEQLCDLIIDAGYELIWEGLAAIRKDMSAELLIKMKKAGCQGLNYGIESASDPVLKSMRKNYAADDSARILKLTKQAGILTRVNIIVGLPGEGEAEFRQTVQFVKDNAEFIDEIASCNICFIMPQSELEFKPHKYDIVLGGEDHWLKWKSVDGTNTNSVRVKRAKELVEVITAANIPMGVVSIFDNDYTDKLD